MVRLGKSKEGGSELKGCTDSNKQTSRRLIQSDGQANPYNNAMIDWVLRRVFCLVHTDTLAQLTAEILILEILNLWVQCRMDESRLSMLY